MIRVLVADDHAVVRRGVIQILDDAPDLTVAGQANSGHEVLHMVRTGAYDVLLLDVALPDLNGIEVLKQAREVRPELRILMLSMYPEEQYALRSLRAGASGYLTKESAPDDLVAAIRKVAGGGNYVSPALAERLASRVKREEERPLHERLSDREYQVMVALSSGRTVSEIAADISLSVKSISTYRSRILEKLELKNTAEIVRYALEHRLGE